MIICNRGRIYVRNLGSFLDTLAVIMSMLYVLAPEPTE